MQFQVALQLYTVRDAISDRFIEGLEDVARIGYKFVEFAGFGNSNAKDVARAMDRLDLKASGAHVPLGVLVDQQSIVDDLHEIGCAHATLPWIPEEMRSDWVTTASKLDNCAEDLAAQGIAFGYHNHAFEFESDGWERLTTLSKRTNFQLDVFWAEKAGHSAVKWIEKLSGRLPSIHCKDLGKDGADIEIGEGVLDWRAILDAASDAGVETLVLEMDTPRREPILSAIQCLQGISRYL
jgi:sugar phosphate isomerase/epimerase